MYLFFVLWQSVFLWSVPCHFHSFSTSGILLSFAVTHFHLLSLFAIRFLLLSNISLVSLVAIRCTTRSYSISFFAIRCQSLYHSLSLNVPLVYLFINDPYLKSFYKKKKLANLQIKVKNKAIQKTTYSYKKWVVLHWSHEMIRVPHIGSQV